MRFRRNAEFRAERACLTGGAPRDASIRLKLVDCMVDEDKMTIIFSGDKCLTVDLTEDGYSGPEAVQLNGPDGSTVIWS